MSRPLLRTGIAAASAALAVLVSWALRRGPEEPTVELVDSRAAVEALLEHAAATVHPTDPSGAPVRASLDEKAARIFFPAISKNQVYDEHRLACRPPNVDLWMRLRDHPAGGFTIRTNALGLREDGEVSGEQPDLRVIAVGDSHVDGLCDNADSFPNLLEAELARRHPGRSIEVLNAACGGWSFYNYLGALEGLADLRPDVFVLVAYGGNDFQGALSLYHYQRGDRPPKAAHDTMRAMLALSEDGTVGLPAQYLVQAAYLYDHPREEQAALDMTLQVTAEVERRCRQRGIALLCVYLPPWPHAQPELCANLLAEALARAPLPEEALAADERLADAWLAWLAREGIAAVDLRPAFHAEAEPLYWKSDHHLNLAGHRAAARALLEPLDELGGLGR